MPDESLKRRDRNTHEIAIPAQDIGVRWGLREDEPRIAELMELNGMRRALAFEERYIVAEKNGEVLAALRYRTESKRLLLGLLVSDPWTRERPLAVALYAGAGGLAQALGAGVVRARHTVLSGLPRGYRMSGRAGVSGVAGPTFGCRDTGEPQTFCELSEEARDEGFRDCEAA